MSSMFSQQQQREIKKIKKLQNCLNNINISNVYKTKDFIVANGFLDSNEGRLEVVNNLINASDIRPLSISMLANLARDLISVEEDLLDTILKRVFEPIPETYNDMFSKSIDLKFLRRCMDKGVFTFEEIKCEMKIFREQYPNHKTFLLTFFCWFAPEMDSQMFEEYYSLMNEQIIMKKCPGFLIDFASDFPKLRRNGWKLFRERVKYGHFMDTLPYLIKYDKIETFSMYTNKPKFNIDQNIISSIYEPSKILREGAPLIHLAAFYGSIHCFKFLLLNGANLQLRTDSNRRLAQYAVAGGNSEIVRICEQKQLDFSRTLFVATLFHQNKIFNWIKDSRNYPIDERDQGLGTPFHQAVVGYNMKMMYDLIQNEGIDPNIVDQKKRTPLHYAALNNSTSSIKFLLSLKNINPNIRDNSDNTPFHYACKHCQKEIINEFLKCSKVDINIPCRYNVTPLHILAEKDHFNVLPQFLQMDDLVFNCLDDKGRSPLHYAVINENVKAIEELCSKKGVKVNITDKNGMTPLHLAVINGEIRVINALLISNDIDINAQNDNYETPLHCAVSKSFMDPSTYVRKFVVERLLKVKGIQIDIKNKDGQTPLSLAQKNKFFEIARKIQLDA